jgi:glycosyltransferase involved in cell wall biosynthesis
MIPTLEGGGAERQLSMLAAEQTRRGHSIHVAIRRGGIYMQAMKDCGINIHELGDFRSINPRLFFSIRRTISGVKPDIVQTWLPQMDILGGLGVFQSRARWIISERTSGSYYRNEIPAFARLRFLLSRYASAAVANSNAGENYWREAGPRALKLATVRNAVDFKLIQEAASRHEEKSNKVPFLLVVARFDREKAHSVIVRAFANLSGQQTVNLLMIGKGNERPVIEKEIEAASLSNRIRLLPYQRDWWQLLKTADGLISMGRYEGNPNVALEAMAGGCPVILSDTPAHREIADASAALFVPLDNVEALSRAIVKLVTDRDGALQRAEEASRRTSSMTASAMADGYEAVYREVLSRNI